MRRRLVGGCSPGRRLTREKGGDVAQLGERLVRNEEVVGSSPIISTILPLEIVLGGELAVPCTRNPLQRG